MRELKQSVFWLAASAVIAVLPSLAWPAAPTAPPANPWLAASTYALAHMAADFTPLAGPKGPSRRLNANEIQWKPTGPANNWAPMYSGPYPNGKRVVWVGGYDRISKLDADTLQVLTTYAIGGNTYFGDEEIRRDIDTMDSLDDESFLHYNLKLWAEPFKTVESFYRLLSNDNELYMSHRAPDGAIVLQVYGDADASGPESKIVLRREWKIPADISHAKIFSMNMTFDGWVIVATSDGTLIAVSRDLTTHYVLKLPCQHPDTGNEDVFTVFLRNGITIDEQGGIYVVTRDNMHRVKWTGSKLSLDEADGAWTAPYPNASGRGSGTTPELMGWGPGEDHLVLIADGTPNNNAVVFWRDSIPDDWKGLPGLDRRIAGITPIRFGIAPDVEVRIENTPVVHGYGGFFDTIIPVRRLPDQGGTARQYIAEMFYAHVPGHEMSGGAKIYWDPQARQLKTGWQSQLNFAGSVCTASGASEMLYCWGNRHRDWTLEGIDWMTGKSVFTYVVGKSQRFSALGGNVTIAPNGAVDCGCAGGMGTVRLNLRRTP